MSQDLEEALIPSVHRYERDAEYEYALNIMTASMGYMGVGGLGPSAQGPHDPISAFDVRPDNAGLGYGQDEYYVPCNRPVYQTCIEWAARTKILQDDRILRAPASFTYKKGGKGKKGEKGKQSPKKTAQGLWLMPIMFVHASGTTISTINS